MPNEVTRIPESVGVQPEPVQTTRELLQRYASELLIQVDVQKEQIASLKAENAAMRSTLGVGKKSGRTVVTEVKREIIDQLKKMRMSQIKNAETALDDATRNNYLDNVMRCEENLRNMGAQFPVWTFSWTKK